MNNRSDMNRMVSMMGKVKSGPYMMGNEPTKKESRATKKSMKETVKSTPAKMPVISPTSIEDSFETGKNIMYREPINSKRAVIKDTSQDYNNQFKGITDNNLGGLRSKNREQVNNYNIGKLSNFGEIIPETKTFAEFKKWDQDFRKRESRGKAPDKMYNHSTGKKQPTGRELVIERNAKRAAETHAEAKAIRRQWEEEARLRNKR